MEKDASYLKAVREQYENFPYPPRDPNDEREQLISTATEYLARINHYCFRGRLDLKTPFRVLVAGGGTGDATIFLAEQLRHTPAEIVHLDISQASMDVAKQRADICNLNNIQWIHASILDIPTLNLGRFDYINCSGVLHHLADPEAGFDALLSALDEKGGMGIMLYAKYGRTAIYQLQELMRLVNQGEPDMQQKIDDAKLILAALPSSNWYQHSKDWMVDVVKYGDNGIYDLLLHSQDRAYSVPELYEWFVDKKGMHMFLEADFNGHLTYEPSNYLRERTIKDKIGALPLRDQEAIAELLAGNIIKHTMYVTHSESSCATIDDIDNIPFLVFSLANLDSRELSSYIEKNTGKQINLDVDNGPSKPGIKLTFIPGRYDQYIFRYLDGSNSLREIFEIVKSKKHLKKHGITTEALLDDFRETYRLFHGVGGMLLRHKETERFEYLS